MVGRRSLKKSPSMDLVDSEGNILIFPYLFLKFRGQNFYKEGECVGKKTSRRTNAILCKRSDSDVLGVKNVCEVPELSGSGNISKYLQISEK
jgi:hypothetical protein